MQSSSTRTFPYARLNSFRGTKQQVIGHSSSYVQPAWKPNAAAIGAKRVSPRGSRILLSQLLKDVTENEVEDLFKKTVGPLSECILVYNSQARSKGMAIVTFARSTDAEVARAKYDGKMIDGSRSIKIEIIHDGYISASGAPPSVSSPSLFSRLAPPPSANGAGIPKVNGTNKHMLPRQANALAQTAKVNGSTAAAPAPIVTQVPPRRRQKKGPRRLIKKQPQPPRTVEDLDKEMDDYRAQIDGMSTT